MPYLQQKMRHPASGVTAMLSLMVLGPRLSLGMMVETAKAHTEDFWQMLDSRPPQTGPPATPPVEDTQDAFAIPHKAAA